MTFKWLSPPLLLALVLLSLHSNSANAMYLDEATEVGLIFPAFQSAKLIDTKELDAPEKDPRNPMPRHISLQLWTRAAKYELTKVDFITGTKHAGSKFVRIGAFEEPPNIMNSDKFFRHDGQLVAHSSIMEKADLVMQSKIIDLSRDPNFWVRGDAYAECTSKHNKKVGPTTFVIIVKDNRIQVCLKQSQSARPKSCATMSLTGSMLEVSHLVKFTAIAAHVSPDYLYTFLFDSLGRMFDLRWIVTHDKSQINSMTPAGVKVSVLSLSSLIEPFKTIRGEEPVKQWELVEDLTQTAPDAAELLKDNLELKMRATNVEAIMPIKSPEGDGYTLAFANGFRRPSDMTTFLTSRSSNSPKFLEKTGRYHIFAMNAQLKDNIMYYHMFYDEDTVPEKYFYFFAGYLMFNGSHPGGHMINLDISTSIGDKARNYTAYVPNDMVGYTDDQCNKMISFYDVMYHVSEPDRPLWDVQEVKLVKGGLEKFTISAAMVIEGTFYFFTQSNILLTMKGKLENNCQELVLDFNSVAQQYSQDYLIPYLLKEQPQTLSIKPYLLDYREHVHGRNDVNPDFDMKPVTVLPPINETRSTTPRPDNTTEPPTSGKGKQGGNNIIIIVIGLILGGLILASLLYVFCLRNSDKETPLNEVQVVPELHAQTIRSSIATGGSQSKKSHAAAKSAGTPSSKISSGAHKSKASQSRASPSSPKSPKAVKALKSTKSPKSKSVKSASPKSATKSPQSATKSPKSATKSPKSPKSKSSIAAKSPAKVNQASAIKSPKAQGQKK